MKTTKKQALGTGRNVSKMADLHKTRKFEELEIGDLFTHRGILFTKILPDGTLNAISDTTTGSKKVYFAPNVIVEKLDE